MGNALDKAVMTVALSLIPFYSPAQEVRASPQDGTFVAHPIFDSLERLAPYGVPDSATYTTDTLRLMRDTTAAPVDTLEGRVDAFKATIRTGGPDEADDRFRPYDRALRQYAEDTILRAQDSSAIRNDSLRYEDP